MPSAVSVSAVSEHTSLADVFAWLTRNWWRLAICALICGLVTFAIVRRMPLQYTATATIVPGSNNQGRSSLSGPLAGIANLAGVAGAGSDKIEVALAILESRSFIDRFLQENRLTDLMLAEGAPEGTAGPALREQAFKQFRKHLQIKRGAGQEQLIRLEVTWTDPELAAQWANQLVNRINAEMRRRAITNAQQRRMFLESELARNQTAEMRIAISEMIANELKTLMVARQPDGFAFETLDPAVAPTKPSGPRFVVLTAAGAVLGLLFGIIWSLVAGARARP